MGTDAAPATTAIFDARSHGAVAAVRVLFEEYATSIGVDLGFQGFARELLSLPGRYAPPRGRLMLARVAGAPAGCIALRPRSRTVGEIKRLYVRPQFRGQGLGRRLAERVLRDAERIGYDRLVLDTLSTMTTAVDLYRSLGFVEVPAYYDNPIPGARFFSRSLPAERSATTRAGPAGPARDRTASRDRRRPGPSTPTRRRAAR